MRFMVHMPTRSRPSRALQVLERFRKQASKNHEVVLSVVIDHDDASMNNARVLGQLQRLGCRVTTGSHKCKVEACNAGIQRDFDVLLLASDDMTPVAMRWDEQVGNDMLKHFPNLDGAIHYNDGHRADHLCTFPVMGVNLFKKFGYVYHPDYMSLACDNEFTELLRAMNRLVYVPRLMFRHDHFSFGKAPIDALYRRNEALMGRDTEVFHRRKAMVREGAAWGFDQPPVTLSILIASLRNRSAFLKNLLDKLNHQINGSDQALRAVEIVVDRDNGEVTIGVKRQRMLQRAVGEYIAFIDDDDEVCPNYVRRVLTALASKPHCVGLVGEITEDGRNPRRFLHSIRYSHWYEQGGVYYRTPNHLNAVRRDLALQAAFGPESFGEDHAYSNRLTEILRALPGGPREESCGDEVLYFYRCRSKK